MQKRAKKRPTTKRISKHPALYCGPVAASALFTPNTGSRPRPGEQSITLQRNGRLKSLEGQKTDAELQVTCTKGRRRGSAQAAAMPRQPGEKLKLLTARHPGWMLLPPPSPLLLGGNCCQGSKVQFQAVTALLGWTPDVAPPDFWKHKVLLQAEVNMPLEQI